MNALNDGGPAFPIVAATGDPRDGVYCANGLSIRDWFAGMALQAIPDTVSVEAITKCGTDLCAKAAAHWAHTIADAMIQQREKGGV
jgi:hypothetical protein